MNPNNIIVTDYGTFVKNPSTYGHFFLNFESAKTGKSYEKISNNTRLIDKTFNAENPLKKDLLELKKHIKG